MSFWKAWFQIDGDPVRVMQVEAEFGDPRNFSPRKFGAAFRRFRSDFRVAHRHLTQKQAVDELCQMRYRPRNTGWTTILHIAAERNPGLVKWLVEMGADVDVRDERDWTPLDVAAYWRQGSIVTLLMAHGLEPSFETFELGSRSNGHHSSDGWRSPEEETIVELLLQNSSIHKAAYWGCYKRVEALLRDEAGLASGKDARGETPLHHAVRSEHGSENVIELLIASGGDPYARDNKGLPPTPQWSTKTTYLNRAIVADWLRKHGANSERSALTTGAISDGTGIRAGTIDSDLPTAFDKNRRVNFEKVGANSWYLRG